MKEFTEDEKVIARNIDKKYKWIARDESGMLYVHSLQPVKRECRGKWIWINDHCEFVGRVADLFDRELFKSIKWEDNEPTLIRDIYNPSILDEKEREYLKTILNPFHDKVVYVKKIKDCLYDADLSIEHFSEYLYIKFYNGEFSFPDFAPGKMYSGMELNKKYKLYELGITYTEE